MIDAAVPQDLSSYEVSVEVVAALAYDEVGTKREAARCRGARGQWRCPSQGSCMICFDLTTNADGVS